MKSMLLVWIFAAILGFAQDWTAQETPRSQFVTLAPVSPVTVSAKTPGRAEIRIQVAPGFHINSSQPRSSLLIPTVVSVTSIKEIRTGKPTYPPGKEFTFQAAPSEKLDVYSGNVQIGIPLTAAKPLRPGTYTLQAELKYQACDDRSCFPPKSLKFEIPVTVVK